MKPCAGVGGAPCPHKKAVVRGDRCPDCKLAEKRRRQRPGFGTIDGELRRWKDRQEAIEAGEDVVDDVNDEVEVDLFAEDDEGDEQPPPPRKVSVSTFNQFKPGTRQAPKKATTAPGELPWWATAKPGEMTKTAEHERERMQWSKEAKKVDGGKIID